MDIIHITRHNYIHVKDQTENIVYLVEGPTTFVQKNHEVVVQNVTPMVMLKPNHYLRVINPVSKLEGEVVMEGSSRQVRLRYGEEEIRTYDEYSDPFPLYPGERVNGEMTQAKILNEMKALKLFALTDFKDGQVTRNAGDEWVVRGPMVYIDRVEVQVLEEIDAQIIEPNTALLVRAKMAFSELKGGKRISGEEWLVRQPGPYIPQAEEEILKVIKATILSDTQALRLKATSNYKDCYGKDRKAGEEWVVTNIDSSSHIPDVYEQVIETLQKIVLNRWQYCVVLDPVGENGHNKFGQKELRKGELSFFLKPGENLQGNKISNMNVLGEDEALLLLAKEKYEDEYGVHMPGERWMVIGPRNYIPDIEVEILEVRKSIPLDDNEGIYVRDNNTGEVRMETGKTYLLKAHEDFWEKYLPDDVEILLQSESGLWDTREKLQKLKPRQKHIVVTYEVPHNSCVQIFDYKKGENKIYFGPELIKLHPYEQFTVLNLSGGNPKVENIIKSLILRLGPDSISDVVEVETSDHARLYLRLIYSWQFLFDRNDVESITKLFQVKDFVGDCCKSIASRIRGTVSMSNFDNFHKESSSIVQAGVFGLDHEKKLKKPLKFKANNLIITNVDIQSQEPIETKIRMILNESMKGSMETTIKIQEAESKHREDRANQEANGTIELKKITDETLNEDRLLELLKYQALNEEIRITGMEEAKAKASSEENEIRSETELEKARLEFEAEKLKKVMQLEIKKKNCQEQLKHLKRMNELEVEKAKLLSESEISKVSEMVEAIGKKTLVSLARAGPDSQAKILGGLGVKSLLITDGKNPINLFNTAQGMIGGMSTNMDK